MSGYGWIVITGLSGLALVAIALSERVGPLAGWWRHRQRRGIPNLNASPTGGPSQDIRVVITNRDRTDDFHATARVVAARNYPNQLRIGSYAMMWLGRGTSTVEIRNRQTDSLLVARWSLHIHQPYPRLAEVRLNECNGSEESLWDGFRWSVEPEERLPEFHIDISISAARRKESFQLHYTLRPSNWAGPLELINRLGTQEAPGRTFVK